MPTSSNEPDLKLVGRLEMVQYICLAAAGLISAVILCGWLVPVIGSTLPQGWALMKANTALGMSLCCVSLALRHSNQNNKKFLWSSACASIVLALAISGLVDHMRPGVFWVSTILNADTGPLAPGLMPIPTASFLSLLALMLIFERLNQRLPTYVADILSMMLVFISLVIFAGYCFGAWHLLGQAPGVRASPQTLTCMVLLTFVEIIQRTRNGFFSVFVGVGIGSRIVRRTLLIALLGPYLLIGCGYYAFEAGWLSVTYAAALTATMSSILLLIFTVVLAWKINDQERGLRDLSLADELTKLHNRRGFQIIGEHALLVARRVEMPLTVLFFDVDGLKKVNDTMGHDVGSQLLVDVATLLRDNFRSSDVVARIGGDEFAVLIQNRLSEITGALNRLDGATAAMNRSGGRRYLISFTVGEATFDPKQESSLAELVDRADTLMYQRKRLKGKARNSINSRLPQESVQRHPPKQAQPHRQY